MKTLQKSVLATLLLSLVALFTIGCGDSNNNSFVATGNNGTATGTGNLNFQFVQARTTNVPTGTTDLLFEFRDAGGVLVLITTVPFATDVTVTGVPEDAAQVAITALQNGFPVGSVSDDVTVTIGQTTEVNLDNATNTAISFDSLTATPDPTHLTKGGTQTLSVVANFSDSSSVTVPNSANTFTPGNEAIVSASDAGVLTGVADGGNTTVAVSWTFNNVTRTDSVLATVAGLRFEFGPQIVLPGGRNLDIDIIFRDTLGKDQNAESLVNFTIVPATNGVSIVNIDELRVEETVDNGTTFAVQATYTDPVTGVTHTATTGTITAESHTPG